MYIPRIWDTSIEHRYNTIYIIYTTTPPPAYTDAQRFCTALPFVHGLAPHVRCGTVDVICQFPINDDCTFEMAACRGEAAIANDCNKSARAAENNNKTSS
jgi:hypothetical protein